jgi:hypothetical protein
MYYLTSYLSIVATTLVLKTLGIQDESLADIRTKIMHCLLLMTDEFTSRSIKADRDSQNLTTLKLKRYYSREDIQDNDKRQEEIGTLESILSWCSSNHNMVMLHDDGMCNVCL